MIARIMARFPRLLLRLKGGALGPNSRIGTLQSWSWIKRLTIGDHVYIGPDARMFAIGGITIGDGTIVGPRVTIYSSNHNFRSQRSIPYDNDHAITSPVVIGRGCWIGDSCIILPGAKIGDHCLIGAGSVIRGTIPEGSLVTGNPGIIQKQLSDIILAEKRKLLAQNKFYLVNK